MPHSARASHDFDPNAFSGPDHAVHRSQRRRQPGNIRERRADSTRGAHFFRFGEMTSHAKRRGLAARIFRSGAFGYAADAEDIDGDLLVLKKLNGFLQLGSIVVDEREGGIGAHKTMVVDLSAGIAG